MKRTILLADDHRIMREGLRTLIETHTDVKVVGEAADGRAAVELVGSLLPDVILMDVTMPNLNGVEATRRITARYPRVKVIVLSMHASRQFVVEMFRAGANGYMVKDCTIEDIVDAVETVMGGRLYLSSQITDLVLRDYVNSLNRTHVPEARALTSREREVLQLIAEGRSTKEIAYGLGVSINTVDTHRRRIMEKLNVNGIAELTKYAIRNGIISL